MKAVTDHRAHAATLPALYQSPERQSPHQNDAGLSKDAELGGRLHHDGNAKARLQAIVSKPVEESRMPPARMLRHCAETLDVIVGHLALRQPVSLAGRSLIAHIADRLRAVAEVLQ